MQQSPDPVWLAKAAQVMAQLRSAPNREARNAIIDKKKAVWGELKDWLLSLSHQKCWFSEAKDCFNHWEVEHYRPKTSAKDEDGTQHEGYWWLAFDWRNYRVCGNVPNRKKGTFFPLRTGCPRCDLDGDHRLEDPMLLDPTNVHDTTLLTFSIEGRAVPDSTVTDEWEKLRVLYSVERYSLDFPNLMDKRKVVWAECSARIQEYREELARYHQDRTNQFARSCLLKAAEKIREMLQADQELSAVARACVRSSGDPRVITLLQVM